MTTLIEGKYYSVRAISREVNFSLSKLYNILYMPEFDRFRIGSARQLYKYCEELITMVNELYKRRKNAYTN